MTRTVRKDTLVQQKRFRYLKEYSILVKRKNKDKNSKFTTEPHNKTIMVLAQRWAH